MSIQYIFVLGGEIIQEGKIDVKTPVIKINIPAFLPGVWNPVKGGPEPLRILRPRLTGARTPTADARKSLRSDVCARAQRCLNGTSVAHAPKPALLGHFPQKNRRRSYLRVADAVSVTWPPAVGKRSRLEERRICTTKPDFFPWLLNKQKTPLHHISG